MNYRSIFLALTLLMSACTTAAQVAVPTPAPAPQHRITRVVAPVSHKPSPAVFRESLMIIAGPYYPHDLDNFGAEHCTEFPEVVGVDECWDMLLDAHASPVAQHYCLLISVKMLVAGEVCERPPDYMTDAARLAMKYATMISSTSDPALLRLRARSQLYTAALIARQYLSEDEARRAALKVYVVLWEFYERQRCRNNADALQPLVLQIHEFERQFLGSEDIREFPSDPCVQP